MCVSWAMATKYGLVASDDFDTEESDISNHEGMHELDFWDEERRSRRERLEFQMLLEQIQAARATKHTGSDDEGAEFGSLCFQQGCTNLNHRPSTGPLQRRRQRSRRELGRYRHQVERRYMNRARNYQAQRKLKQRQYLDELTERPMIPPQTTPLDRTGQPKTGN